MIPWIMANAATIVIALLILIFVFFAARSVYKNKGNCSCGKNGGCSGCGGSCSTEHKKRAGY